MSKHAATLERTLLLYMAFRAAMQAADQVTDAKAKASALSAIGLTRALAGNLSGAKESFTAAKASADSIKDTQARIDALHARLAKLENRAASGTDAPAPGSHQSPDSVP